MSWLCYLLCFFLSFLISSQEFAQNNYPINKRLLYSKNLYFNLYGIGHGLISCLILFLIEYKKIIDCNDLVVCMLVSGGIGLGIKGFTHLSFYEKKSDELNVNYGPKEIIKVIENFLIPHVNERHDVAIKDYISKKEKHLTGKDKNEVINAFVRYIPFSAKKDKKYVENSYIQLLPEWNLFEIQEYYIEKYGIKRYDKAIKHLRTTTTAHSQ